MRRQTVSAWCDWLAGVTSAPGLSVNELLAALPAQYRDPLDADPPTPVALFADPYHVDKVADFGQKPSRLPAIYVNPDGPVTMDPIVPGIERRATLSAAARIIVDKPDAASSQRYAEDVARAVEQSTEAFLDDSIAATDAARTREGVRIVTANRMVSGPWYEAVGEARAVAIVAVQFEARDKRPRG